MNRDGFNARAKSVKLNHSTKLHN